MRKLDLPEIHEEDPIARFTSGEYYDRILVAKISAGAFRTWHCIRRHAAKNRTCFPGQRLLQQMMHCSNDSIKGWVDELVKNGWLAIQIGKGRKGSRHIYTILDGHGSPLPKSGTKTAPKSRNSKHRSWKQEQTAPESRSLSKPSIKKEGNQDPLSEYEGGDIVCSRSVDAALRAPAFADAAGHGAASSGELELVDCGLSAEDLAKLR